MDEFCGCDFCVAGLQKRLDPPHSADQPEHYLAFVKERLGTSVVTKENYAHALSFLRRFCYCEHASDPNHPDSECEEHECGLCGMFKHGDPLYYDPICRLQRWLDIPHPNNILDRHPQRYMAYVKKQIGELVTDENYDDAAFLLSRDCDCDNIHDPNHSESECIESECTVCALLKCGEPLHYHHDGCPYCVVLPLLSNCAALVITSRAGADGRTEHYFDDHVQQKGPAPELEDDVD